MSCRPPRCCCCGLRVVTLWFGSERGVNRPVDIGIRRNLADDGVQRLAKSTLHPALQKRARDGNLSVLAIEGYQATVLEPVLEVAVANLGTQLLHQLVCHVLTHI